MIALASGMGGTVPALRRDAGATRMRSGIGMGATDARKPLGFTLPLRRIVVP